MDNSKQAIEASVIVLEKLIDTHSLAYVVEMLSRICYEKAEYRHSLARTWERDAHLLSNLAGKVFN